MKFKPIKQFNTILKQEYFEPTISWSFRVVLALNVPLILIPLWKGFSFEVIWAAFAAYLISLIDYRGLHYKKIVIQGLVSVLIFFSAMLGMLVAGSLALSLFAMFVVGMFAAMVRNWSDYGSSIGVSVGFFFLFGLSYPQNFHEALTSGIYLLAGAAWAIVITAFSFPFRPSNPVKRSVGKIWKANTELLDAIIEQLANKEISTSEITNKEIAVRSAIDQSISLFAKRETSEKGSAQHYDILIELRRASALFSAAIGSLFEELDLIKKSPFLNVKDSILYKTLSSLAQTTARLSILIYTSRPEDFTLAKVRLKRCGIAIELFKEEVGNQQRTVQEEQALKHFTDTLEKALEYMTESVDLVEKKFKLKKSDYFESYKLSFNNFMSGIDNWVFLDFIKHLINFNSDQFKYALRVSFGLCVAVFIFKFFQIDHGYWIALTMIIVIQPYYGATRKKGRERIVGTLAGVIVGGFIMLLPLSHQSFVLLLIIVSFFVAYFLRNNYKVGVFFVTIMMVVLMQISARGSLELIGWRVLSTLIGALLAVLAGYTFWPVWEKQRFPALMSDALLQAKTYLIRVINYYNNQLPEHETWFLNRRKTEAANNLAFASVQRMYEEPKRVQQQVDSYFALAGIAIRITREITSIALITHQNKCVTKSLALANYAKEAEFLFDEISKSIVNETPPEKLPDFSAIKQTITAQELVENEQLQFVKSELEKLIFELETIVKLLPPV